MTISDHDPLCPYIIHLDSKYPCQCELISNVREHIAQEIEKTAVDHRYYSNMYGDKQCRKCNMWWPCIYREEALHHATIARKSHNNKPPVLKVNP